MNHRGLVAFAGCISLLGPVLLAEVTTTVAQNKGTGATPAFQFKDVAAPTKDDAAASATLMIVDGRADANSGSIEKLNDGKLPTEADQPAENFFFAAGTEGGRIVVDLGSVIAIGQINTYSWHPDTRGPQVYMLYASDGGHSDFNPRPSGDTDPRAAGWKLLASVDTRPRGRNFGGQYAVSIAHPSGPLGRFRYLLLDMSSTEDFDDWGNTFYSEIDIIQNVSSSAAIPANSRSPATQPSVVRSPDQSR